jgi:hypothetical protein
VVRSAFVLINFEIGHAEPGLDMIVY